MYLIDNMYNVNRKHVLWIVLFIYLYANFVNDQRF